MVENDIEVYLWLNIRYTKLPLEDIFLGNIDILSPNHLRIILSNFEFLKKFPNKKHRQVRKIKN